MTPPLKFALSTVTIGSFSGLGYATVSYFKNDNKAPERSINELVKEEFKYILLSTKEEGENEDQKHWEANWNNYKLANKTEKDLFNLNGWTKERDIDLKEELKKKCATLSSQKIKERNSEIYLNVTTYCGRSVTITDEIGKLNLKALDTQDNGQDVAIWTEKVRGKDNLKSEFITLKIEFANADNKKVMDGCNAVKDKNKKDTEYEKFLDAYKKVCTKPKKQ